MMDFYKDKAKLIDKLLEEGPTSTEEEDEALVTLKRESRMQNKFFACHVVVLALVLVLGMCLFARVAYYGFQTTEYDQQSLNGGYYELEIFQDGDKPHYNTRDRSLHQMRGRISGVKSSASYNPPPRSEKAKTARYIVHNTIWGSVSTISVALSGAPFSVVTSFSDGTGNNSTGIPYFYLSSFDPVNKNIKVNNWASLSVSEAESDYCKEHDWDPEEPLCSRVSLTGMLVHVGPDEIKFAQNALFSRHPVMKSWPKGHDWQTLKLEIVNVWMQDNYGSADTIPVKDYLKVKL